MFVRNGSDVSALFAHLLKEVDALLPDAPALHCLALGLCCADRLFPSLRAFHIMEGSGNPERVAAFIDTLWAHISGAARQSDEEIAAIKSESWDELIIDAGDYFNIWADAAAKCTINLAYAVQMLTDGDKKVLRNCPVNIIEATIAYLETVNSSDSSFYLSDTDYYAGYTWLIQSPLFRQEAAFISEVSLYLANKEVIDSDAVSHLKSITRRGGLDPFGRNMLRLD